MVEFKVMNYKSGQTVYEVGINVSTHRAKVNEQKVLFVGETALFVTGIDAVWETKTESTLYLSIKDQFDPEKVFRTITHSVWTDDLEKARQYANQINEILTLKSNLFKSA